MMILEIVKVGVVGGAYKSIGCMICHTNQARPVRVAFEDIPDNPEEDYETKILWIEYECECGSIYRMITTDDI